MSKTLNFTFVNVQTGEQSNDYDTVESWPVLEPYDFCVVNHREGIMYVGFSGFGPALAFFEARDDCDMLKIAKASWLNE